MMRLPWGYGDPLELPDSPTDRRPGFRTTDDLGSGWRLDVFDVSAFASPTFQVRFRFFGGREARPGWYVDTVVVSTLPLDRIPRLDGRPNLPSCGFAPADYDAARDSGGFRDPCAAGTPIVTPRTVRLGAAAEWHGPWAAAEDIIEFETPADGTVCFVVENGSEVPATRVHQASLEVDGTQLLAPGRISKLSTLVRQRLALHGGTHRLRLTAFGPNGSWARYHARYQPGDGIPADVPAGGEDGQAGGLRLSNVSVGRRASALEGAFDVEGAFASHDSAHAGQAVRYLVQVADARSCRQIAQLRGLAPLPLRAPGGWEDARTSAAFSLHGITLPREIFVRVIALADEPGFDMQSAPRSFAGSAPPPASADVFPAAANTLGASGAPSSPIAVSPVLGPLGTVAKGPPGEAPLELAPAEDGTFEFPPNAAWGAGREFHTYGRRALTVFGDFTTPSPFPGWYWSSVVGQGTKRWVTYHACLTCLDTDGDTSCDPGLILTGCAPGSSLRVRLPYVGDRVGGPDDWPRAYPVLGAFVQVWAPATIYPDPGPPRAAFEFRRPRLTRLEAGDSGYFAGENMTVLGHLLRTYGARFRVEQASSGTTVNYDHYGGEPLSGTAASDDAWYRLTTPAALVPGTATVAVRDVGGELGVNWPARRSLDFTVRGSCPPAADTATDPLNCGACGVACPSGQVCALGVCTTRAESSAPPRPLGIWNEAGPNLGGRLSGIFARAVSDPSSPPYNKLLVTSTGGGVWRLGPTTPWALVESIGLGDSSSVHLERDRRDPSRLYLVTASELYASTDDGAHWTNLTGRGAHPSALLPDTTAVAQEPRPFAQMCCDPPTCSETRVFWGPPCGGLVYSLDSGLGGTFQQVYPFAGGSTNPDNCLIGITAEDNVTADAGLAYFGTYWWDQWEPTRLWRSDPACNWCTAPGGCNRPDDPGGTSGWESASGDSDSHSIPDGWWAAAIAWTGDRGHPHRVLAELYDFGYRDPFGEPHEAGLLGFRTENAGTSWSVYRGPGGNNSARALIRGPSRSLFYDHMGPGGRISPDLGATWFPFCIGDPLVPGGCEDHIDVRAYYADDALQRIYYVTDGVGHAEGLPEYQEWNVAEFPWARPSALPGTGRGVPHDGLHVWQSFVVAPIGRVPGRASRLVVGSMDNEMVCTDDDGVTWHGDGLGRGGDYVSFAASPSDPRYTYALTNRDFVQMTDGMRDLPCDQLPWDPPSDAIAAGPWQVNALAVHPTDPLTVAYIGFVGSVNVSIDGGDTWNNRRTPAGATASVYFDPENRLYVGTDSGVFRCDPSTSAEYCLGGGWESFALNSTPPRYVSSIRRFEPSGYPSPTYFLGTSDGLFRGTGDSPSDWRLVTGGDGYVVNEVEAVPGRAHCVYAGLGFVHGIASHRGGVRFSSDNGETWISLTAGEELHNVPIADLAVDPFADEAAARQGLWVASFGRGVWKYDWGAALPAECR